MGLEKSSRKVSVKKVLDESNAVDVTIDDVARIAGVSVSTVSRILNDKPDVAPDTRQRVKQVIEDLGFSPHALARRLAVRRSRTIALIFPLSETGGRAEVATFIVKAAFAAESENYLFSLVAAPADEKRLLNLYRSAQVEGVILMEVHMDDWRVELLKKYDHPFVMIGRCADTTGLSFIDFDFEAAVVSAVDHLVQLGHQRVAFFNSNAMLQAGYGPAVRSFQGYERALNTYKIKLLPFDTVTPAEAAAKVIEANVTGVVLAVQSMFSISEFLRSLQQAGYQVPEDLAVVCMQADEIAQNLIRPMTSVGFDINIAAERAAKMLIDKLEGRSHEIEQIVLPPQLIIRESTKLLR